MTNDKPLSDQAISEKASAFFRDKIGTSRMIRGTKYTKMLKGWYHDKGAPLTDRELAVEFYSTDINDVLAILSNVQEMTHAGLYLVARTQADEAHQMALRFALGTERARDALSKLTEALTLTGTAVAKRTGMAESHLQAARSYVDQAVTIWTAESARAQQDMSLQKKAVKRSESTKYQQKLIVDDAFIPEAVRHLLVSVADSIVEHREMPSQIKLDRAPHDQKRSTVTATWFA